VDCLTISEAAAQLGVTTQTAWALSRSGKLVRLTSEGPIMVTAASVAQYAAKRRGAALRQIRDVADFAARVHRVAWPVREPATLTIDGRRVDEPDRAYREPAARTREDARAALRNALTYSAATAIFGAAALDALTIPPNTPGGCRWCWTSMAARIQGGLEPEDRAEWHALFGTRPCRADRRRWEQKAGVEARLRQMQLDDMRERAQQQAQRRVSQAQAALRTERAAAASIAAQTVPRALTASAVELPPVARRSNLTEDQLRERDAKRARFDARLRRAGGEG
jgi:hypothetical protein